MENVKPLSTPIRYETPRVVASLDALGIISDADGVSVGATCGSICRQ